MQDELDVEVRAEDADPELGAEIVERYTHLFLSSFKTPLWYDFQKIVT